MTDFTDQLMAFLEEGTLQPVSKIPLLRHFPISTVCLWASTGRIPALKISGKLLTHPSIVAEVLRGLSTQTRLPAEPSNGPKASSTRPAKVTATKGKPAGRTLSPT